MPQRIPAADTCNRLSRAPAEADEKTDEKYEVNTCAPKKSESSGNGDGAQGNAADQPVLDRRGGAPVRSAAAAERRETDSRQAA
ncbi:hypothetical protein Axi01nite_40640 [Actinoplanes xinjiangensis]|nr:hypothetical protein Axi01nite_40640 [Actinoplanes xinjiangensis]